MAFWKEKKRERGRGTPEGILLLDHHTRTPTTAISHPSCTLADWVHSDRYFPWGRDFEKRLCGKTPSAICSQHMLIYFRISTYKDLLLLPLCVCCASTQVSSSSQCVLSIVVPSSSSSTSSVFLIIIIGSLYLLLWFAPARSPLNPQSTTFHFVRNYYDNNLLSTLVT